MVAIDTLTYARRLEKAGVPREQAEAHTEAVHPLVREEVATRADVEAVRLGGMLAAAVAITAALVKLL